MPSLAGYTLLGKIAETRTGALWKARDEGLDRDVAVKQVSAGSLDDTRIRSEARILAGLDHPNIVRVFTLLDEADSLWLVEEWVDGASLAVVTRRAGRLRPEQALGLVRGALQGLSYAHEHGVIHGDVAPGNILVDTAGVSKLVDFGLAGGPGRPEAPGTPGYASPEAGAGDAVDARSDIYAMGAVLGTLLHGGPVFEGSSDAAITASQHNRVDLGGVHPALVPVLDQALAVEPDRRYRTAAAFLSALEDGARAAYGAGWLAAAGLSAGLMAGGAVGAGIAVEAVVAPAVATSTAAASSVGVAVPAAGSGAAAVAVAGAHKAGRTAGKLGGRGWLVAGAAVAVAAVVVGTVLIFGNRGSNTDSGNAAAPPASATSPGLALSVVSPSSAAPPPTTENAAPTTSAPPSIGVASAAPVVRAAATPTTTSTKPPAPKGFSGTYKVHVVVVAGRGQGAKNVGKTWNGKWYATGRCTASACTSVIRSSSGGDLRRYQNSGANWTATHTETVGCIRNDTGKLIGLNTRLRYVTKLTGRKVAGLVTSLTGTTVISQLSLCTKGDVIQTEPLSYERRVWTITRVGS